MADAPTGDQAPNPPADEVPAVFLDEDGNPRLIVDSGPAVLHATFTVGED